MKKYSIGQLFMCLAGSVTKLYPVKSVSPSGGNCQGKYSKCNTYKSGFTLLEILLSMLLIGVGAIVAINMQLSSMGASSQANYMSTATLLAESRIDSIRSHEFRSIEHILDKPGEDEEGKYDEKNYLVTKDGNGICKKSAELDSTCFFRVETEIVKNFPIAEGRSYYVSVKVTWFGNTGTGVAYDTVIALLEDITSG